MNSALVAGGFGVTAIAQDENHAPSVMLEEVMVTARKKEESMQDVPVAVSAMNEMQMEEMKVRDLNDVWRGMPNVNFLQNGTIKGTANYAIRGVGAVSSIPGVEPVVGVFVDGVYLGQANGLITDMFDMQSIQVLRGPQGTLFGKNVTGGAVLINTNMPEEEFAAKIRTAVDGNPNGDGGLNTYAMGMVNGSLIDSLSGRLVAYYQKDDGWFENKYNGPDDLAGGDDEFGESKVKMFRPSVRWQPTDDLDFVLSYEYQDVDGDGPAAQSSEFERNARTPLRLGPGGQS